MTLPLAKEKAELDLEKSMSMESKNYHLHPASSQIMRKLVFALIIETVSLCMAYYEYDQIALIHPMLAPTLLGCVSGALAQSTNQYLKKKYSLNKIAKFMVWGSINGYFTSAWINILVTKIDNMFYRIIIDQTVGAIAFQLIFNILNSLWDQGELFSPATRASFFKSLKYSYCFWPFFSILSFSFIPQSMMFPCNCLANLFWNLILSKLA
ncbi:conserved hypothetical protein [Candida tropicalis MYA-3404]|uniref:Protein sym1 n=1 Tax=Candida tropicalis (strain ATCC MYA-3404 / T1) TaxID=294747 RepID=C5M913_CANTT|nr:conserved hypothetical protein [Candida tropicalis MYA-3404]EER34067.1 conserved hypothetical protein [Candida tropicalis MYA-3404]KAG4407927.1 hypothetical protein JTP64_003463 [Candida tropicalis]